MLVISIISFFWLYFSKQPKEKDICSPKLNFLLLKPIIYIHFPKYYTCKIHNFPLDCIFEKQPQENGFDSQSMTQGNNFVFFLALSLFCTQPSETMTFNSKSMTLYYTLFLHRISEISHKQWHSFPQRMKYLFPLFSGIPEKKFRRK